MSYKGMMLKRRAEHGFLCGLHERFVDAEVRSHL